MTYLQSILMGLLQGVAEFLPISSSGHLALFQYFFGMENVEANNMFFAVLLHFGTFVSVCVVYWRDILDMIREFFSGVLALFSKNDGRKNPPPARRMVMMIIVGTLPLFVILPVKGLLENFFSNVTLVSIALLLTGIILFFSDRMAKGHKTAKNATVVDALLVGCAQAIAVTPGISRAGATISAGMMRGFDRSFAVRFSFLLSLPAVLGANILAFKDAMATTIAPELIPIYLVGTITAGVIGFFAIQLVKLLADQGKFGNFAYYCWAVGLVSLVAGFFFK